jgi:hypothetical protein
MVNVENYMTYTDIEIGVDNDTFLKLNGNTSIIFRNVTIQPHIIKIRATNPDKKIITFSKNVDVVAGKNIEVVLKLP